MKILQLGKFYPPNIGGIETVMFDITELLNTKNIKCDVLCSNDTYKYSEEIINNYTVYRTKTFGKYFSTSITPQMIWKLKEIVNNYDIIHVHLPDPMASLALFFINPRKQKIVLHWHSDIIKQKFLLKLYEPLQNWLMKKSDVIIATTPKYMQESKYLQKHKNKCVSIPIGIDSDRLQYIDEEINSLKKIYNKKHIIFSLGRLAYYKGFKYLIESAKYLSDDFIILIGGNGELKSELEDFIKKERLENKVKLLGRIEDNKLGNYYKLCDIFCLPSIIKSEAFGVVQIEAMSFGKPIVATSIEGSGVDWVNKHKISGVNVEVKNAKSLAIAFETIMVDNETYDFYSKNAIDRFNTYFKRENMVDKIIKVYENS